MSECLCIGSGKKMKDEDEQRMKKMKKMKERKNTYLRQEIGKISYSFSLHIYMYI